MTNLSAKSLRRIDRVSDLWVGRSGETHLGRLATAFGPALLILATAAAMMAAIL